MLRKNISLLENDEHCISAAEKLKLTTLLNQSIDFVSNEEQAEIDALNIDFDDMSGEALTINDVS